MFKLISNYKSRTFEKHYNFVYHPKKIRSHIRIFMFQSMAHVAHFKKSDCLFEYLHKFKEI